MCGVQSLVTDCPEILALFIIKKYISNIIKNDVAFKKVEPL